MRQTRVQYPGATLGRQAGHYPTPAVKGMSCGVVRKTLSHKISINILIEPCFVGRLVIGLVPGVLGKGGNSQIADKIQAFPVEFPVGFC